MKRTTLLVASSLVVFVYVGCNEQGGSESTLQLEEKSADVQWAETFKEEIDGLQEALKAEGVSAVQSTAEEALENWEGYEEEAGQYKQTLDSLYKGVQELKGLSSKGEVSKKIQELVKLAETLPGASLGGG